MRKNNFRRTLIHLLLEEEKYEAVHFSHLNMFRSLMLSACHCHALSHSYTKTKKINQQEILDVHNFMKQNPNIFKTDSTTSFIMFIN